MEGGGLKGPFDHGPYQNFGGGQSENYTNMEISNYNTKIG